MAKGIYEGLITTGLGLLVAVPAYLFYLYFVGRAKRLVHRIERAAIEIVNIICDARADQFKNPISETSEISGDDNATKANKSKKEA